MVFAYRERKDAFAHIQWLDLARALSRQPQLLLGKDMHSYLDLSQGKLVLSSFWDDYPPEHREMGRKSDIYVQAFGCRWHADDAAIQDYLAGLEAMKLPQLYLQCFAVLEQFRWMRKMLRDRGGMREALSIRCQDIQMSLNLQAAHYAQQSIAGERLLIALYHEVYRLFVGQGWLDDFETTDQPSATVEHQEMPVIDTEEAAFFQEKRSVISQAVEADHTSETAQCSIALLAEWIDYHSDIQDVRVTWFHIQPKGTSELERQERTRQQERFAEKRDKGRFSQAEQSPEAADDSKETLNSWHRETQQAKDSPFRMDLEQGSLTDSKASGARMTDREASQMTVMQGSGRNKQGPGKNLRTPAGRMRTHQDNSAVLNSGSLRWLETVHGKVVPIYLPKHDQEDHSHEDEYAEEYTVFARQLQPYIRKMKEQFQKTLEKQRTARRTELWTGRMGKKIVRAVLEPLPRLFYKKQYPDRRLDAVFTLLIDCSASMYDKMDETKLGAILFHEVLRALHIPHQIVGFWEDVDGLTRGLPNYFYTAVSFEQSLSPKSGRRIMQLEAQQDNRDGYAIREMTKQLLQRQEKQKTLIVFCDGEPSAADYFEEGVTDTYLAVQEARKRGIDVIGVFLAGDDMEEGEMANLQQIYGRYGLTVPNMDSLTAQLIPLLKKLIVRRAFQYDI